MKKETKKLLQKTKINEMEKSKVNNAKLEENKVEIDKLNKKIKEYEEENKNQKCKIESEINNNTKTNLLLNSDTFKHKNKNFAFKSFHKNEIIINQKNNQSVKKDSKKNIHKKNKKNLISLGNKNSKLELQINDSVCNNQSCSFMNTPIVKYTNTQKYRTTTSKIIKKEDFFMTENNYLNSMENLLLEIKNHLEIKNTKNKNKNKNTKKWAIP